MHAIHIQRGGGSFCACMWMWSQIRSLRCGLSWLLCNISPICMHCIFFVDGAYGCAHLTILQIVSKGLCWSFSVQMSLLSWIVFSFCIFVKDVLMNGVLDFETIGCQSLWVEPSISFTKTLHPTCIVNRKDYTYGDSINYLICNMNI